MVPDGFGVRVGSFAERSAFGEHGHAGVDFVGTDVERVKWPTVPLQHGFAVRVTGFGHGFHELFKAGEATDVLGRSAALTVDEARIIEFRIGGEDAFDLDEMAPVIAEIVGVDE